MTGSGDGRDLPRVVRLLLLFSLGAGLAILCLEVIGIPLLVITLALLFGLPRRNRDLPSALISVGAGFAASVSYFAVSTGRIDRAAEDSSGSLWFAAQFAVGVTLVAWGAWRLLVGRRRSSSRRSASRTDMP